MTPFEHRFEFDLDKGIREQVVERLNESPKFSLETGNGPAESGIYVLYHKRKLVYVGKASRETTKSGRTLRMRLSEHRSKIASRRNIKLMDMKFRYLTFESEWWVFAAEFSLITHFAPAWNFSGFGSKTPGIGRPGTDRISRWNLLYPPKIAKLKTPSKKKQMR